MKNCNASKQWHVDQNSRGSIPGIPLVDATLTLLAPGSWVGSVGFPTYLFDPVVGCARWCGHAMFPSLWVVTPAQQRTGATKRALRHYSISAVPEACARGNPHCRAVRNISSASPAGGWCAGVMSSPPRRVDAYTST